MKHKLSSRDRQPSRLWQTAFRKKTVALIGSGGFSFVLPGIRQIIFARRNHVILSEILLLIAAAELILIFGGKMFW